MTTIPEERTNEGTAEQRRADEDAGFNSIEDEPTGPEGDTPVLSDASPPSSEPAEPSPDIDAEKEPVKPKLAEISDDAFQKLLAKATEVDEIKAALEQRFNGLGGKLGGLERVLQEMKSAGAGQKFEVLREDLKELFEEFPEFGDKLFTGLNRMTSRVNLAGQPAAPLLTAEENKQFSEKAKKQFDQFMGEYHAEQEIKRLAKQYPDWTEIVGQPINPAQPGAPLAPYRQWLLTQPADYQNEINGSIDADEIGESIAAFKDYTAPKKPAVEKPKGLSDRERQLRSAVQPRGIGGPASTGAPTDEESAMKQGFDEEAKRYS